MIDQARDARAAEVLAVGGEMGALMRSVDWAATPLGPVEGWSPSLRTIVKILLANRFPHLLWWGPDHCQIYNDAYRPVLGAKHPRSLGQPARECWPEIWQIIGPLILTPYTGGPATWDDDLFLEVNRHGFVEETHFTVAYSPVPDESVPGGIGGVLATVHEITQQVIQERRLAVLRDLGARSTDAKTAEEACAIAAAALEQHARDVPFALLYLIDADQKTARLAAAAGVSTGVPVPALVELTAGEEHDTAWPFAEILRTDREQVVGPLRERIGVVPPGPWSDPPDRALVLPAPSRTPHRPAGLLVLGLSARLALDDSYRSFCALVASQIGTAIGNARAYEEERARAEALAELDRAKTIFFSNVSHEFRTPLTLALAPVEDALADADEPLPAHQRERMEIVHRNGLRLLRLVNTLLDFSRIEAGRIEARYEPTDLAALTADLASVFRSAVERAGLRLAVDCPPLPGPVYVDRDMWEKIVLNLLSNAFKFTFQGEIAVRLHAVDGRATLEVRDTGTGIAAEELPHIFERFYRARTARGRTPEGTGIGLALVRELVALHGGAIGVESAPDAGTAVTVALPLGAGHLPADRIGAARIGTSTALGSAPFVEEALRWLPDAELEDAAAPVLPDRARTPRSDGTPVEAEPPAARARVLLADDNADMRAYLRRLLGERYTVEAVADGAAALETARARPPDLVLADVMMPGLDGFELLRELRTDPRTRALPIILLSARAGEEARVEGLGAGADDYLIKPFAANELLARVQAHLALARLRQEAHAEVVAERDRLQAEVAARGRAEEALAAALARLQVLQTVSDAALSQLALPALLRRLLERITADLEVDNTAILLLDETERVLTVHLAHGPEAAQAGQMRVPVGQGVAGRIAATRQPLIVADLRSVEPVNPLLREQMASLMGVPLLVEGRLIGVMHVDTATPRRFTDDDLQVLQLVADRVARALDSARAYRHALEARDQVARLQRVTAALSAAMTSDAVADVIIAHALEAMGASAGVVALLSDDGASFTNVRVAGYRPEVIAAWPGFPADAAVPIADAVRAREPLILASLEERNVRYPHLADVQADSGDGALMAIPLLLGERVVGGLGLGFATGRRFDAEERAALRALGELCAQALERARLYEAEQQARAEAEAERQHLRELLMQAPAIVCVLRGPAHVYEVANPLYLKTVGRRDPGELLGRPIREALPDAEAQGYVELLDRVYASGTPFVATELPLTLDRRGDGVLEEILVNTVLQPYRNAADAVEGIMVHAVEVTEQVQARRRIEDLARQVQDERDRLRQILDTLPVGVVIVDARGRVEVLNQAGRNIVGIDTRGQTLPSSSDEHTEGYRVRRPDGTPYPAVAVPLSRSLLSGEEVRANPELHLHAETGRETPLLVNSAPLRDGDGTIIGAVAIFQDITELRDLERAREEFLSSAAHDLKNPLTSIRGQAQLAQRRLTRLGTPETAPVLDQLARIQEGTDAMLGLINDLVDVTRQQMGGALDLQREPTDLIALVQNCVAAQGEASGRPIRLEAAVPELSADVDAGRVARVVGNLLSNALKYSPADRPITVRIGREEGAGGPAAVLAVRDEGIGIPAVDLPHIFDRFKRARNVAGHIQGTGIGLASARGIVEQHGGTIAVESTEGAGATFTVRLPLSAP